VVDFLCNSKFSETNEIASGPLVIMLSVALLLRPLASPGGISRHGFCCPLLVAAAALLPIHADAARRLAPNAPRQTSWLPRARGHAERHRLKHHVPRLLPCHCQQQRCRELASFLHGHTAFTGQAAGAVPELASCLCWSLGR
jgi:hypothetical protein